MDIDSDKDTIFTWVSGSFRRNIQNLLIFQTWRKPDLQERLRNIVKRYDSYSDDCLLHDHCCPSLVNIHPNCKFIKASWHRPKMPYVGANTCIVNIESPRICLEIKSKTIEDYAVFSGHLHLINHHLTVNSYHTVQTLKLQQLRGF